MIRGIFTVGQREDGVDFRLLCFPLSLLCEVKLCFKNSFKKKSVPDSVSSFKESFLILSAITTFLPVDLPIN